MVTTQVRVTGAETERTEPRGWWGLAGLGFVVSMLAMFSTAPALPAADAEVDAVVAHFVDQRAGVLLGVYLAGLGAMVLVAFAAAIGAHLRRRRCGEALSRLVLGAAVASGGFAGMGALAQATLASRVAESAHGEVVVSWFVLGNKAFSFADFANATLVGALAVAALVYGLLPRWVGYTGIPVALAFFVGAAGVGTEAGTLAPFGTYGFVVFSAFLVWLVALSVHGLRQPATEPTP